MSENALAALGVINGAARQVSANRNPNYTGSRESIIGTPANQRKLVAQLHHRRPDIVEELNLNYRLQPARCHSSRSTDDRCLGKRRVEYPVGAEIALQAKRQLEHAAFAFDHLLLQILLAAAIGHVLPEDHDALVSLHLIAQRGVDQVGHGLRRRLFTIRRRWFSFGWSWLSFKCRRRG